MVGSFWSWYCGAFGDGQKSLRPSPQSNTQLKISKWASRAGADYTIYPLTALFYFYGRADDNPRARDTARIGIEALADAEITVNVLKTITQRPRPETKDTSIAFFRGGD